MKRSIGLLAIIPAMAFGLSLSMPAFAQDAPAASASGGVTQDMKNAGTTTENAAKSAGSDTENVAKEAYDKTKHELSDADITTKVKVALDKNDTTEHAHIHVKTSRGTVTLWGRVPSKEVSDQAEQIAKSTDGVTKVTNHLHVHATDSSKSS